jgi:hypothetical protein
MTGNRKRLSEKIGHVVQAADEEDTKVSLADSVRPGPSVDVCPWPSTCVGRRCPTRCQWRLRCRRTKVLRVAGGPCWPRFSSLPWRCGRWYRGQRTPPRQQRNRRQECEWSGRRWGGLPSHRRRRGRGSSGHRRRCMHWGGRGRRRLIGRVANPTLIRKIFRLSGCATT